MKNDMGAVGDVTPVRPARVILAQDDIWFLVMTL